MENELNNNEEIELTDKEIFTEIWTSPRLVFRYINEKQYDKYVTVLLFLSGISATFGRASTNCVGDTMNSLGFIIGVCIIGGGLLGWVTFYISSALISWTGKWLNGQGNTKSFLRIGSHAMIPSIVALIFLFLKIGIYGIEIFKSDGDIYSAGTLANIFFYGASILELLLGIWTVVLLVIGISEVQKFSIWKSILNMILPGFVVLIPLIAIILLMSILR